MNFAMNPAMTPLTLLAAALVSGALVPFQAGANAALGRALGHPLWATLVSLAISALCILPVMIGLRVPAPMLANLAGQPKWIWIGGLVGVVYLTAALMLAPKLGAAGFMTAVIAGQILASLLIDYVGAVGFAAKEITASRLAGAALVVLGVLVMQGPALLRLLQGAGAAHLR